MLKTASVFSLHIRDRGVQVRFQSNIQPLRTNQSYLLKLDCSMNFVLKKTPGSMLDQLLVTVLFANSHDGEQQNVRQNYTSF